MKYKHLLIIFILVLGSQNAIARTEIAHQCDYALFDVARVMMAEKNVSKINKEINKATKSAKIRQYIRTKWIPKIKSGKDFTPNAYYMDIEKYIKECTKFATP